MLYSTLSLLLLLSDDAHALLYSRSSFSESPTLFPRASTVSYFITLVAYDSPNSHLQLL